MLDDTDLFSLSKGDVNLDVIPEGSLQLSSRFRFYNLRMTFNHEENNN